jgi:hypothetical protein
VVGSSLRLIEEAPMWLAKYGTRVETMYRVTDRLHDGHTVRVLGHEIAPIVSAWLAELGAASPLVEDLARAARVGDWAAAYAVADQLSVDVTVAAAA